MYQLFKLQTTANPTDRGFRHALLGAVMFYSALICRSLHYNNTEITLVSNNGKPGLGGTGGSSSSPSAFHTRAGSHSANHELKSDIPPSFVFSSISSNFPFP